MRKFFLILFFLTITLIGNAQEHLSFKGIPIEGSLSSFCQKLKAKGFTQIDKDNNVTVFKGYFTERKAVIAVGATDYGKNVHSVAVMVEESSQWKSLEDTYDYFKSLYTRKYGHPVKSREQNPSPSDDNYLLMHELKEGKVNYESLWSVPGGNIELSIMKWEYLKGIVRILYRDSLNAEIKIQKELEDI